MLQDRKVSMTRRLSFALGRETILCAGTRQRVSGAKIPLPRDKIMTGQIVILNMDPDRGLPWTY